MSLEPKVCSALREAGWYPDQNDPDYNRYWNGRAWTARRHPAGVPPPADAQPRSVDTPRTSGPRRSHGTPRPKESGKAIPIWMWVIGVLFLIRAVFTVIAVMGDSTPTDPTAVSSHAAVLKPTPGSPH